MRFSLRAEKSLLMTSSMFHFLTKSLWTGTNYAPLKEIYRYIYIRLNIVCIFTSYIVCLDMTKMAQEFKISQRRRLIMVKGRQFISMELV